MVISQGEVWWADLPAPTGSGPGFRRPVAIVQGDALNRSRIATVVCVPLTSNLRWADAPGNVPLSARLTGLPKDSVANVSQVLTLDRDLFTERVGKLPPSKLELLLAGIDIVFGRQGNAFPSLRNRSSFRRRRTGRRSGGGVARRALRAVASLGTYDRPSGHPVGFGRRWRAAKIRYASAWRGTARGSTGGGEDHRARGGAASTLRPMPHWAGRSRSGVRPA